MFNIDEALYTRNGNFLTETRKQLTKALMTKYGISAKEAYGFVLEKTKEENLNKVTVTNSRYKPNGDRIKEKNPIQIYFDKIHSVDAMVVPSLTVYTNPNNLRSIISIFNEKCSIERGGYKKNFFNYTQKGDYEKASYNLGLSNNMKTANNSVSGALVSPSTNLYMPSGHSSLTSTTRVLTSTSNAVTESFVMGNKLFDTVDKVYSYFTVAITYSDKQSVSTAMKKFKLRYPTTEDILAALHKSTDNYWLDDEQSTAYNGYASYLNSMTDIDRACIYYTNDLYHMRELNRDFVYEMMSVLSVKKTQTNSDCYELMTTTNTTIRSLAHYICMDEIRGSFIDYDDESNIRENSEKTVGRVIAATMENIIEQLKKYSELFKAFFMTKISPPSIAYIKEMYRETIVISNTDSTCGSYDDWVKWYFGSLVFNAEAMGISATIMTLNKLVSDHHIIIYSSVVGVPKEKRGILAMKNEFCWPVFTASNVAGHYFAQPAVREDIVLIDPKPEIKGVHILSSKTEQTIVKSAHGFIDEINKTIMSGGSIDIADKLKWVANYERTILEEIQKGSTIYYERNQLLQEKAYKKSGTESKYREHTLWSEVFSVKYGATGEPPYMAYVVPLTIDSKTDFTDFLNGLDDRALAIRFEEYMRKSNRNPVKTLYVPMANVVDNMIEDILSIVNTRSVVEKNCKALYMILEAIGFVKNENRLLCESGY